jgi:hypothetical protein
LTCPDPGLGSPTDCRCLDAAADDASELLIAVGGEMDRVGFEQVVARRRQSGEIRCGIAENSGLAVRRFASQLDVLLV